METITHLNIKVEGTPFQVVQQLEIRHNVNDHATAVIAGEVECGLAQDYLKRIDERSMVRITTTAEGQPSILFCGVVANVGVQMMSEYALLTLTLRSMSWLLDQGKKNKSYQNTAKTHEDVMKQALEGEAPINMQVTDRAIGSMQVQCNETNWEFCKRMASRLAAPLLTTIHSETPVITVGIPQSGTVYDLTGTETQVASTGQQKADLMAEDRLGISIKTTQYMFIGDSVSYGAGSQKVSGITASMQTGMLVTTVSITTENGFVQQPIVNTQISGKMYTGQVKAVQKDMVQVHLVDIDSSYDDGGDVWLPYSTAYSSSDGSGFYCMPAVGDYVRVFFPGTDEGTAFAASSVSVSPGANVTDKQWRGPKGKQILMTEEGIFITTNADDKKIFIDLTDESGITITSNKNISICAKNNVSLLSNNTINMTAEKNIVISTAESYIDIKPKGIEIGAENIYIK